MTRSIIIPALVIGSLALVGSAVAQGRPAPPSPPERGYGTAAERQRAAEASDVRRERQSGGSGGGGTSAPSAGESTRPEPVPEARAKEYLTAVEKRLAAIKSQRFDFVASEPAAAGVKWQVRGRYESMRTTERTLFERIDLSWAEKDGKLLEERILFETTVKGDVRGWSWKAASGLVEQKGDPLARVFHDKVLFLDILPLDLSHHVLSHAGEMLRAGEKMAVLTATPRHGRKQELRILCDRRTGAMKETAVRAEERNILTMTDVVEDLGGIHAPTLRRVRMPGEEPSLVIHYSGRRLNEVMDPARFRAPDLGR